MELLAGRVVRSPEVPLDIIDGACEDVEVVAQRIELAPCNDQLPFGQVEFAGPLSSHPVPLSTRLGAELARSAPTRFLG